MSISETLEHHVLQQRNFMLGSNLVSLSLRSPRLMISSQFLFFNNKSLAVLKPHLAKYEDGMSDNNFLAKLVECGYLVSFSSQSHDIIPFILNKLALVASPMLENRGR